MEDKPTDFVTNLCRDNISFSSFVNSSIAFVHSLILDIIYSEPYKSGLFHLNLSFDE